MLWMRYTIRHVSKAAIGLCRDAGVPGTFTTRLSARCQLLSSWLTPRSAGTSSNNTPANALTGSEKK